MKVLLSSNHLNSHTLRFYVQTLVYLLSVLTFSYHYRIQKPVMTLMIMIMILVQGIQILITGNSFSFISIGKFSGIISHIPLCLQY